MKERKDVSQLEDYEIANLVNSILELKKKPSQIKNTGNFPSPKNRYDDYVYIHIINFGSRDPNSMVAHQRPTFTPWHRIYLARFERELQNLDSEYKDVTIPYWDWTNPESNKKMWDKKLMGGSGCMVAVASMTRVALGH